MVIMNTQSYENVSCAQFQAIQIEGHPQVHWTVDKMG